MNRFRGAPLTIRFKLPDGTWLNLLAHLKSRLVGDPSIEGAMPGGLAKASLTITGEHTLVPGSQIAFWDGNCPCGGGEIEASEPDPTSKTTSIVVRGPAEVMADSLIYDKTYIKAGMGDAKDSRAFPGVSALYRGGTNQEFGEGMVQTMQPWNAPVFSNAFEGWYIDMGPNNAAKTAWFTYQSSANAANVTWFFWNDAAGGDGTTRDEDLPGHANIPISPTYPGPSNTGIAGGFAVARRFFGMFMYTAGAYTPGSDVWLRISNLRIATDLAYLNSGNGASVLTVDMVAKDIVANAGIPNISSRTDMIAAGTIPIQELISGGDNPKALLERGNASDGLQWRFTLDAIPALQMRAVPTDPQWLLRPSDYTIERGQGASLQDVFNAVKVYWNGIDGSQNVSTVVLTPDTTILAQLGRVRTASVKISRVCNSAEAAGIGALFLREHREPAMRASIRLTRGFIRAYAGGRFSPTMIQGGDTIRLLGTRNPATGQLTRDGVIYGIQVNPKTGVATLSLNNDTTIFDRQLAYFESRAA